VSAADERATLALIAPYVPSALLRTLARGQAGLQRVEPMRAATLLLDLAGFTPIVVSLSAAGPRGIDALGQLLTEYFTAVLDVIESQGGVVYQFAGDSVFACFEVEGPGGDAEVAHRAAASALAIQKRLRRLGPVELLGQTFGVQSRIGLGFGDCHQLLLGSTATWLHPVIAGAPLSAAVLGEKKAQAGEVIASSELWELLPEGKVGEPRRGSFLLSSLPPAKEARRLAPPAIDAALAARAEQMLSPALFTKVTTGHQEYIGDFRDITCLFVRCGGLDHRGSAESLWGDLNPFYELLQREAGDYGGTLLQTDFTDKGDVFFVLFGAPTARENKELLATRLASKVMELRARFPFLTQIQAGIATGHAYCGNVGSATRKSYTAVGEVVNLASRLLTYRTDDGILIDANTERKVRQDATVSLLANATLKGIDHPVPIYEVKAGKRPQRAVLLEGRGEVIGRKAELAVLARTAEAAFREGGSTCVLSGEAGIGKSRLAAWVVEDAPRHRAQVLTGACYPYEMFTPFFPWKEVLKGFFQLLDLDSREAQLSKIRDELARVEGLGPEWLPVVAAVVGLSVEEEAQTRALDARRKNEVLFQIIFELIRQRSTRAPLLLLFEDLHWADKLSLDLIEHVAARIHSVPVLLVATSRPDPRLQRLLAQPSCEAIELSQMSPEDIRVFLRARMRLAVPNIALEEMVLGKAQGNPFFVESIVHALLEQGYLVGGEDGRRELGKGLSEITIPDSIQDVVLARMDRLPEANQTLLKVASVIGRVFTLEAARVLLPEAFDREVLWNVIRDLSAFGLIVLEAEEPVTCLFKHVVIRDVAYNTLLVSSREDLHRRFARHLEAQASGNLDDSAGLLAYHFLAGNDEEKGLEYSLLAARNARAQYANQDALHHYGRAIELLERPGSPAEPGVLRRVRRERAQTLLQAGNYPDSIRLFEECLEQGPDRLERAEIHVGLGRAFQEKGESGRAIQQLERALMLLGRAVPRSLVSLYLRVVGLLFIRGIKKVLPWIFPRVPEGRLPEYLEQLSTLISLIKIYYFVDVNKLIWSVLVALHMADRSRSWYGQAVANSNYGSLLFGAGLLGASRRSCEEGLEMARRAQDQLAEGIAQSRLATQATFANELQRALPVHEDAVRLLRHVGDVWETQTSLMLYATTHFLRSELKTAEGLYREMGALGRQVNALMHQAWAHAWVPFCRYLLGEQPAAEVRPELRQALEMSVQVNDLANQCAALNHLAVVAVREGDVEEAARAAVAAFSSVWRYQVLVPFLQIGLVDAAEAALFALENGAKSVPRGALLRIVRRGAFKARLIGRMYPYLRGPALRVTARAMVLQRGPAEAAPIFDEAIALLEATPNRWELGVTLLDAAAALPGRRAQLAARAREVLSAIGARAELRRLERLEEVSAPRPRLAAG